MIYPGASRRQAGRFQRQGWMVILAFVGALILFNPTQNQPKALAAKSAPRDSNPEVWGSKPVLAHFLLNPELALALREELDLSEEQYDVIAQIARQEDDQIQALELESQAIINDPKLTIAQKSRWVENSAYNQRLFAILHENQRLLQESLGSGGYSRLVAWIETRWTAELAHFNRQAGIGQGLLTISNWQQGPYPRSFDVYATRYDAGERKIVALPDKCLKFANGGAMQCSGGYAYGQNYSVAISYKGKFVVALVGESGPWNVDDNYWSKTSDPQPRRLFTDLSVGLPEAQAAYFNGYNGGLDQFGRLVTSPVAIDISRALAADLGLPPGNNLVTVSFLWTEGWDNSQPVGTSGTSQPGEIQTAAPSIIRYATATPNPDGSIVHLVQSGQTLTGIANVYGITLQELLTLNQLKLDSVIHPGDRIIVKIADPTKTLTESPIPPTYTPTQNIEPSRSPALSTATQTTELPVTPEIGTGFRPAPTKVEWLLVAIAGVILLGIALLAWGFLIRRK